MNPKQVLSNLKEAQGFLKDRVPSFPKVVITLGSGLASLLDDVEIEDEISYSEIPNLHDVSVVGHVGKLVIGKLGSTRVACMKGRLHYYEGLSMDQVVFPCRALALAGAHTFVLTNAVGGLHPEMAPRDLLLISDHINMTGNNPLMGKNIEELGTRFPDMSRIYDPALRRLTLEEASKLGVEIREGVYVGCHGPSYETPAEIRMYRQFGADVVGMSTVPEAIALRHMQKRVLGISFITNLAAGVTTQPLDHNEVLENAKQGHPFFATLVKNVVNQMKFE